MEYLLLLAMIGLLPAAIAHSKGRNFFLWWFYGAALFIVAVPHAIIMQRSFHPIIMQRSFDGQKRCPQCTEWVSENASRCRHCGSSINGQTVGARRAQNGSIFPLEAPTQVVASQVGKLHQPDGKECPRCAEIVRTRAQVCRFCGHEFKPDSGSVTTVGSPTSEAIPDAKSRMHSAPATTLPILTSWKGSDGEMMFPTAITVLQRATELGYSAAIQPDGTISLQSPSGGVTYCRANSEILRFGRFLKS